VVEAAEEACPIVRITSELDGLPPALLGRRLVEAAGEAGPIVWIASGLGDLLPALLGRRVAEAAGDAGLIVRIALGRAVEAAGDAGPILLITSGLNGLLVLASFGRRAAEGAGDAGPIVRIASEVVEEPTSSFRPCSAFVRSRRRRKVSAPRGFFRGDWSCGFFLGDPPAASDSATPPLTLAPQAGFRQAGTDSKLFETFGPLGAPLPCFSPANVALANIRSEGQVEEGRGRGSHDAFLLDLHPSPKLREIHPTGHWSTALLRPSRRFHNHHRTQLTCGSTSHPHNKHFVSRQMATRLCRN